jgi:DnaJ-class molecular chaperone
MNTEKNPGDEVAPGTEQTGTLPCETCGGTGSYQGELCTVCGGTGEIVVNIGDA